MPESINRFLRIRTLFINDIEAGTIEIIGGEDYAFEGVLRFNQQFESYKKLFLIASSEQINEEELAKAAQNEIDELKVTVLNHYDYTRQDIDLFVDNENCYWREILTDSDLKYIYFYRVKDRYGEFSNFYPPSDDELRKNRFRLFMKGRNWKTTEHYYQAMKFQGIQQEEVIRNAKNAFLAAKLGNELKPFPCNWDKRKDKVMYEAVFAKFTQNQDLKKLLINTGNTRLIEHTKNDYYWGDGGDGSGKNKLGKILMQVRNELSR
jgi:ribA/ribD-fused uncharacterized protein